MATIPFNGPHEFRNADNFESEDRKGKFVWVACTKCGIRGKRRGHGDVLEISRPYTIKRAAECQQVPEKRPSHVEIVDVNGLEQWGFERGKHYQVIDPPAGVTGLAKKAIWVTAPIMRVEGDLVPESVMLLSHEFKYLESPDK